MRRTAPAKCLWNIDFAGAASHKPTLRIFGEGRQDVEEQLAHRVGRIVDARPDLELHAPTGKVIADGARIGNRTGLSSDTKNCTPDDT